MDVYFYLLHQHLFKIGGVILANYVRIYDVLCLCIIPHIINDTSLYSIVSTLKLIVGIVVTSLLLIVENIMCKNENDYDHKSYPNLSMYNKLVFPAASKPTKSMRPSFLPIIFSNALTMNEAIVNFSWRTVVKTLCRKETIYFVTNLS